MLTVELVDPYDHSREWGNEKYSVQGMLIRQEDFPAQFHAESEMGWNYSDRAYEYWREACEPIRQAGKTWSGWIHTCLKADFLRFCATVVGWEEGELVTGGRVTRYSDAGGYAVYLVNCFRQDSRFPAVPLYRGNGAPNVRQPVRPEWDLYGMPDWPRGKIR